MKLRLTIAALAACLLLATGVRPCAAAMQMGQPADEHGCCDHPEQPAEPKTGCESLCAMGDLAFTAYEALSDLKLEAPAPSAALAVAAEPLPPEADFPPAVRVAPPDDGPPLFVRHAAFLI